ncbi:PREDICTED: claudin domain-containing protein 2-like isoform X1 [Acropora digitifera]|uniref:claudin domain-containing protein 2-like isoform X1 n=1 Tax=Acropora digitifera TaxID=70779 RepID=UPI00077AA191|nr:PREDICTED: claudin domain-containing protein 2-like isoform X1 [Acropora digitifera]XP_029194067.1 claudin domain-containing protein 2-like isoform X1 [Acropora millepora]
MIKVITAVVCAFAAILMIILSVSTTYWLQWQIASDGRNITHYRGLFRHCWESRDNVTNELQTYDGRTDCDGKFTDFKTDWNGVTIAFMVLGLLFHFIAFIVAIVAACRKGHPFPSFWVAGMFFVAAILVVIALLVYTFHNWKRDVFFSWSYGGGWSTVALSIIAVVLIMADR